MTNGAAALFMRTAYQHAAIYFGDTPLVQGHPRFPSDQSGPGDSAGPTADHTAVPDLAQAASQAHLRPVVRMQRLLHEVAGPDGGDGADLVDPLGVVHG